MRAITQDKAGRIWFAAGKTLLTFDGYEVGVYNSDELGQTGAVNSCVVRPDGKLLLGGERGLLEFDPFTNSFHPDVQFAGIQVRSIILQGNERWMGTNKGLYHGNSLVGEPMDVYAVCMAGDKVYVGNNSGLYVCDRSGSNYHRVKAVGDLFVSALAPIPDQKGLLVGTPSGLWQLSLEKQTLSELKAGLPVVKTLFVDQEKRIFVGTDDGLFVQEGGEPFKKLYHRVTDRHSLPGNAVWCLYADRKGNLWTGTGNGLAFLLASQSVETISLSSITGKDEGNQLYCLLADSHGCLWMGGTHGLMKVTGFRQGSQMCEWYEMNDPVRPIPHNRIRVLYEAPSTGVLVGGDGGLLRYDEVSGQFVRIRIEGDANQWVYNIRPAKDGLLQVTTFSATYDIPTSQLLGSVAVPVKKYKRGELASPQTRLSVGEEEWTVVSEGIEIRSRDGQSRLLDLHDTPLSLYFDRQLGKVLVGGVDQLMLVDPSIRTESLSGVLPVVTHLSVNGTEEVAVPSDARLSLTHMQNNLLVSFSDFVYSQEHISRYAFMLKGLQKEWVSLKPGQNELTLTNLPYGDYELYIVDGNTLPASTEGLQPVLRISIAPPWYCSWWAWLLYLLLAALLSAGVWAFVSQRIRLRAERRRRDVMLARAKQKLERLTNDNDALQKTLHTQMVTSAQQVDELSVDDQLLLRITNVIEENMDNPELSVNMLSTKLNVTSKTLTRKLRQYTGMTSVEYIRSMRMKKAAVLLHNPTFSVSEVMYMVGYSNPSYFTRSFVGEYHQTPSEFRNQMAKE